MQSTKTHQRLACGKDIGIALTSCIVDGDAEMKYTTYGIEIIDNGGEILVSFADISTDKKFVEQFIKICTEGEASVIHIADLLEDYLE